MRVQINYQPQKMKLKAFRGKIAPMPRKGRISHPITATKFATEEEIREAEEKLQEIMEDLMEQKAKDARWELRGGYDV